MSEFSYTDKKGRTWDLSLDMLSARRIDKSDFKTGGYYDGENWSFLRPGKEVFSAMLSDSPFMFAVIWAIVLEQAKQKFVDGDFLFDIFSNPDDTKETRRENLSKAFSPDYIVFAEEEFVSGISGETVELARAAFGRSLVDFFRDQATILSLLLRQLEKVRARADKEIEILETDIEETIDQRMTQDIATLKEKIRKIGSEPAGTK